MKVSTKLSIDIYGQKIRGVLENPSGKKLMILVHGFTGDLRGPDDIFIKLSEKLQASGFAVIRFNCRGTPPSDGKFQDMTLETEVEDLLAVIRYAKSLEYKSIGLLGESMGAAVIAKAYDKNIGVMVFWYPCFEFVDSSFTEYLSEKNLKELPKRGYVTIDSFERGKVGKEFISQITEVNTYPELNNIVCPSILLHGDHDNDTPVGQSQKAFKLIQGPKHLDIIKGADHCFRNEQKEVIKLTVSYINKYL